MSWTVITSPRAEKDMRDLPTQIRQRIDVELLSLEETPYRRDMKKLRDGEGFRVRVGAYRIIYDIDEGRRIVLITRVRHRKEAYR